MSSKRPAQNKHDTVSSSDSDESSFEFDSSSENEIEKNPKKKIKEEKKPSKETKKVAEKTEKLKESRRKKVKSRSRSPLSSFEHDIGLDISTKFVKKKAKISSTVNIERKMVKVDEPNQKSFTYPGIVFARKSGDKIFQFNLPLALLPKIIEGLEYLREK